MSAFLTHFALAAPLFILVLGGYAFARLADWPSSASVALTRFVFSLALPALLFRLMTGLSKLPPVDSRLLLAFFGGCFAVFCVGRLIGRALFGLDGVGQSVLALGGIFCRPTRPRRCRWWCWAWGCRSTACAPTFP